VACSPQAWAAATPFALLQAALGLEFRPDRGQILLRNPFLPGFLDEVLLRNLRLGPASVDLSVRRHGADVALHVMGKTGQIQVNMVLD
jgi:glycogen debranching enzyme